MGSTAVAFPPGPTSLIPGKVLFDLRRDPLAFLMRLRRDYGDVAYVKFGSIDTFFLFHPELIKDVLVTHAPNFHKGRGLQMAKRLLGEGLLTSEGEFHLRQRRLAQPAFHRQRIASYANCMVEYARRTGERWRDGQVIDAHQEMMRLTLAVVGKTLFDANVEGEAPEIGEALGEALKMFDAVTIPFAEVLDKLPLPGRKKFQQAKERLDQTIYRIIAARRADNRDRGDLLSMLLMASDTEGDGTGMSDLQLRDEAMTIFLAGHETTANALTWTWFLLAQNPEIEEKLHREIAEVLGDGNATAEDWKRLPYTEAVLAESMRVYPPVYAIGRRALREYPVREFVAPAQSIIVMSQWVMHHDERYFPDPFRFDPARWLGDAGAARPKFCYFPFGGGPRVCIGESFAWMEGVLLLATLAQRWRMRLEPDQQVVPRPLVTLRPKHGLKMRLVSR